MAVEITWFNIVLAAGLLVAVLFIVYAFRKNRELAQLVLEEKILVLDYLVPILEAVADYLPPEKREQVRRYVELLKLVQKVNAELLQVPAAKLRKVWLARKVEIK